MFGVKPGKYIAFFSSYQYMMLVAESLNDLPLNVQESNMSQEARERFIAGFTLDDKPCLRYSCWAASLPRALTCRARC